MKPAKLGRKAIAALLGAALALSLEPGSLSATTSLGSAALEPPATTVSADEQAFALDLLRRLGTKGPDLVLSPSSLSILLSMVEPGAAGATEAGIAEALGSQALAPTAQATGWRMLAAALATVARKDHITLQSANEAWLQDGLPVRKAYLQILTGDFGAGLQHGNLQGDPSAAAATINGWVASRTGGHITHLLDARELQDAVTVLVDAVYLDAPWQKAFPQYLTEQGPFHVAQGTTVDVPMMSTGRPRQLAVLSNSTLTGAELPYAGGRLSALVLMPPLGQLPTFEATLTPARLTALVKALADEPAVVELPKFEEHSDLDLNSVLSAMGMEQAFTSAANFSNLSTVPLMLSFVVQDAQIEVAEKGTEASAASGAGIVPTAVAVPIGAKLVFDHPFLMLVRDDVSGAIVFEAQVGNPQA